MSCAPACTAAKSRTTSRASVAAASSTGNTARTADAASTSWSAWRRKSRSGTGISEIDMPKRSKAAAAYSKRSRVWAELGVRGDV